MRMLPTVRTRAHIISPVTLGPLPNRTFRKRMNMCVVTFVITDSKIFDYTRNTHILLRSRFFWSLSSPLHFPISVNELEQKICSLSRWIFSYTWRDHRGQTTAEMKIAALFTCILFITKRSNKHNRISPEFIQRSSCYSYTQMRWVRWSIG